MNVDAKFVAHYKYIILDEDSKVIDLIVDLIRNGSADGNLYGFSLLTRDQKIVDAFIERCEIVEPFRGHVYRDLIFNAPKLDFDNLIPQWISKCEFDFEKASIIGTFPALIYSGELSQEVADKYSS